MRRGRGTAVLIWLLLFSCFGLVSYGDDGKRSAPPAAMEISSIYGGIGKVGVHVPISVSLYGQSEAPFSGTVTVSTLENDSDNKDELFRYVYPVELHTAETKNLELYVPLGQKSRRLYVTLKDADGKEISQKSLNFENVRDMGSVLVGTLTDQKENLTYLDGVSMEYGMVTTKQLHLDEKTLPEDVRGLELLDILVINDFDTGKLSEGQTDAVLKWMREGGILLFGTGRRAESTLSAFADALEISWEAEGAYENIGLGVEYAEKTPGDSDIRMFCVDISMQNSEVIEESDGIPLLYSASYQEGAVGVYTYDLGELKEFVEKNPTYANKMLTDMIGEEQMSDLYYYTDYGSDREYWNAYSMINIGNTDRLPKLPVYAAVITVYIIAVGPGLYLFLKKKDWSRLYGVSAVLLSIVVSAVIYLLGVGTRFTSQFLTSAAVVEIEGGKMEETSYINIRTPDSRPLSLTVPTDYKVTPLTKSSRYSEQPIKDFDGRDKSALEIKFGENGTNISAARSTAFKPRLFKLSKESGISSKETVTGTLQWKNGTLSGTVKNDTPFELKNAAIVLYGQMYLLGDMKAGEMHVLEQETLCVWPTGMSYVAAETLAREEIDGTVIKNTGKSSLYGFYLDKNFRTYTPDAYLISMGDSSEVFSDASMREQTADGMVLYSAKLEVKPEADGQVYRSGLAHKPEINSGNGTFYGDGMTMYGTDPVAVEYFFGTDIDVEKLEFLPVSDLFLENAEYYYLKQFDGGMYFYNHLTKEYDRMDMAKGAYSADELLPYLSMKNSMIVKYTAGDTESAGVSSLLPHPMVTGREH